MPKPQFPMAQARQADASYFPSKLSLLFVNIWRHPTTPSSRAQGNNLKQSDIASMSTTLVLENTDPVWLHNSMVKISLPVAAVYFSLHSVSSEKSCALLTPTSSVSLCRSGCCQRQSPSGPSATPVVLWIRWFTDYYARFHQLQNWSKFAHEHKRR